MHAYTCNMNMNASTHTNKHVQKWCMHARKVPCMCAEVSIDHEYNFLILYY